MLIIGILVFPLAILFLWLLVIRPYCVRHGRGYTPGYTANATMWIDWQSGKELAIARGDRGMLACCHAFLAMKILRIFCIAASAFII